VGYTIYHNDNWLFVNEKIEDLFDYQDKDNIKKIKIGEYVVLVDGLKLLVKNKMTQRLLLVQLVDA